MMGTRLLTDNNKILLPLGLLLLPTTTTTAAAASAAAATTTTTTTANTTIITTITGSRRRRSETEPSRPCRRARWRKKLRLHYFDLSYYSTSRITGWLYNIFACQNSAYYGPNSTCFDLFWIHRTANCTTNVQQVARQVGINSRSPTTNTQVRMF